MAEVPQAARPMDRAALLDALGLLERALQCQPAAPVRARRAQRALRREQLRLRGAGLAHCHLDAARLSCAQLADGLAPQGLRLEACRHILHAHLAQAAPGTAPAPAAGAQSQEVGTKAESTVPRLQVHSSELPPE